MYSPYSDVDIIQSTRELRMERERVKRKAKEMKDKIMMEMQSPSNYLDLLTT